METDSVKSYELLKEDAITVADLLSSVHVQTEDWYELRYTPQPNDGTTELDDVEKWVRLISSTYVIGKEHAKNHHFHAMLHKPVLSKTEVRDLVYSNTTDITKKGNTVYKFSPIKKTVQEAIPYAIKDGDFRFSVNLEEISQDLYLISYEKPQGYELQLQMLYNDYADDNIAKIELWTAIADARSYYDLRLNFTQVDELVNSQTWKKLSDKDKQSFSNLRKLI